MHTPRLIEKIKPDTHSLFWPPILILGIIVVAGQLLSSRYRFLPPTVAGIMLGFAALLEAYTFYEETHCRYNHAMRATALLVLAVTVVEIDGIKSLITLLMSGDKSLHGTTLLISGAYYWTSNVLAFGLWFWLIDRGGPPARVSNARGKPEFFFPEMAAGEYGNPNWKPGLGEYIYLAFTNATAFSPTDTLPLSTRARALMTAESIISLVVIALVTARAVNILS